MIIILKIHYLKKLKRNDNVLRCSLFNDEYIYTSHTISNRQRIKDLLLTYNNIY